jgi:hypothetical protein
MGTRTRTTKSTGILTQTKNFNGVVFWLTTLRSLPDEQQRVCQTYTSKFLIENGDRVILQNGGVHLPVCTVT